MERLVEANAPWVITSNRSLPGERYSGEWLSELTGPVPQSVRAELEARDFRFLSEREIEKRQPTLEAAARLIDEVPSLSAAAREQVSRIFLLDAEEEYDVSHSEPRWAEWIFVSVPRVGGIIAALRAAENVIHEAMHLQLTSLEGQDPLVADLTSKLPSPWKQEPRHIQGILHGLYVFACISAFLHILRDVRGLNEEGIDHINRRMDSIGDEIGAIPLDRLIEGLTPPGKKLVSTIVG